MIIFLLHISLRIVVQNERYDDWTSTMILLRKLCNSYKEKILNYHRQKGHKVPAAYNSTAAQGNFLETLNMSLNCKQLYITILYHMLPISGTFIKHTLEPNLWFTLFNSIWGILHRQELWQNG